jgi:hypothetical protein
MVAVRKHPGTACRASFQLSLPGRTKADGSQRYLSQPYPDGPNFYMEKIEANMRRLRKVISSEADTAIFLKKYRAG